MNTLQKPWMVAVWPGMGHVAINAGVYLLSQLHMSQFAEFRSDEIYDVDAVLVKEGLIQPVRRPRSRFFLWRDPQFQRDIIVFLGEAQPPTGKFVLCQRLAAFAVEHDVERIFTFAAMGTQMHPEQPSRVFGAATDLPGVAELRRLETDLLEEGHIGGLNGILLGAAQEVEIRGTCLLGEMPHIFHQVPFPKASLVILETFATLAGLELDFTPLADQARSVDQQLGAFLARIEEQMNQGESTQEPEAFLPEPAPEEGLAPADQAQIERLFSEAEHDRSKAFELKQLLDRLQVFKDYEDRFLDLFKTSE